MQELTDCLADLRPEGISRREWAERTAELNKLLKDDRDREAHRWLSENLPAFIDLVPYRKRQLVVEGMRAAR